MKEKKYAGFIIRYFAFSFDTYLMALVPLLLFYLLLLTSSGSQTFWLNLLWLFWEIIFLQWILSYLYQMFSFIFFQSSLGKLLAGLEIEKEDGSKPNMIDALIRFPIGYTISNLFLGIGFLWIIKDPQKKAFHDHFANTVVVKKHSAWPLAVALPLLFSLIIFLAISIVSVGKEKSLWKNAGFDLQNFSQTLSTIFENQKIPSHLK